MSSPLLILCEVMKSYLSMSMMSAPSGQPCPDGQVPPHEPPPLAEGDASVEPAVASLIDGPPPTNVWTLRFPKALEARFEQDTAKERLRTLTIAGTLVAFVLNVFLLSDWAMVPDVFDLGLRLRLWVFTPCCLIGMWALSKIPSTLARELMAIGACIMACVISVYLCSASHSPHAAPYTTGLSMVMLYANVFVRMRFWMAVPTTLLVLMSFVVSLWTVQGHTPALSIPIGLVMLSTALFTLYHLYTLEQDERLNYLLSLRHRRLQQELKQANQQLEQVSRSDALTQVANRRHFDDVLARLWDRAQGDDASVSIIMVDVDHFKAFNDQHGHPAGDACLVKVAESLKHSLRRPGDLLARYGGEEFIAVLNRMPLSQAQAVAERMRGAIEALDLPHESSPMHPQVTVSVGVASMRPHDRHASPQRVIALADEALYQAKNRGRNRVWPGVDPGGAGGHA